MHTVGETKKDTTKVILSLDFFPVKYISTQDDTNQNINNKTIFYSKEQEKLWIAQTVRATNWESIEEEDIITAKDLRQIRVHLYNKQQTEEDKQMILDAMQDDINEARESTTE